MSIVEKGVGDMTDSLQLRLVLSNWVTLNKAHNQVQNIGYIPVVM